MDKCCCGKAHFGGEEGEDHCWFQLQQCSHHICIDCFSAAAALRGFSAFLSCPHCKGKVREWCVVRSEEYTVIERVQVVGTQTRSMGPSVKMKTIEHIKRRTVLSSTHSIPFPTLQSEPTQYHESLDGTMKKEVTVLSLTVSDPRIQAGRDDQSSLTCSMEMVGQGMSIDDICSEESKSNLENIFMFLHSKLLIGFNYNLNGYEQLGSTYVGHNIDEIVDSDQLSLFRCLYSLATGNLLKNSKSGVLWCNQKATVFAAADLIRNLTTKKKEGVLNTLVGHQLLAYTIPQPLHRILNKFGVCLSRQYNRTSEIRASHEALTESIVSNILDPHDLWMILYDNIGFRRCGSQPGWEQFVALQLLRIPRKDLQTWGIYPADDALHLDNVAKYSWHNGKKWEEVREHTAYSDVCGTDDNDVLNLANTAIETIEILLDMEVENKLPSSDECYNLVQLGRRFSWPDTIPKEKKITKVVEKEGGGNFSTVMIHIEVDGEEDDDDDEVIDLTHLNPEKYETNYDANNVIVDRPIAKDLNSKEAVKVLMEYGGQLYKKVVAKEVEDQRWNGVEKVMEKYGTALLGDGNPTHMIQNILQEEDETASRYKNVKAFTGGFHMILEAHRKRGSLFGMSHLEDIFSCWRTSIGQLKWVMNPGDPNQIDSELVMYVLAIYVAAIRALIKTKEMEYKEESRRDNYQPEEVKVCAYDVVDLMLARAKEYPIVMTMLIEIRYAEVIFMLHRAEQDADASLYVTALKYLGPLFASTHATKYVNMLVTFLVEWYCMSDAERVIFTKGIFTRKTRNGRNIWSDKFVEWMMRDLRMWCTNIATPNTASILERTALGLNKKKKAKNFGMKERKFQMNAEADSIDDNLDLDDDQVKELQVNHVFCEVLIFCTEANIFGPGKIEHIQRGPAEIFNNESGPRKTGVTVDPNVVDGFAQFCDSTVKLNPQLPQVFKIGELRMSEYFDFYFKFGDLHDASRSEKDVPLTAINPVMSENEESLRAELARCTSTDTRTIEEYYIVQELHKEINKLNVELMDHSELQIQKNGSERKLDLCALVRRLRMS